MTGSADPFAEQRRTPPASGITEVVTLALPAGTSMWRIHRSDASADSFNHRRPSAIRGGRFDSVTGEPGVLYAADTFAGAVAETLLRDVGYVDIGARSVQFARVAGRSVSVLVTTRDISLVSLRGPDADMLGQGLWLTKSDPRDYPLTREWAAALREAAPDAGGLIWKARHDEMATSYALYSDAGPDGLLRVHRTIPIDDGEGLEAVRKVLTGYRAVIDR